MTYEDRLKRWAIVRLLPTQQWIVVHRFYHRSDADGHLKALRQLMPHVEFKVIFDVQNE